MQNIESLDRPLVAVAALVFACGCGAQWSRRDLALEAGSFVTNMVDARQSVAIAHAGAETNPMIGSHGERVPVMVYALTMAALHVVATDALPPRMRLAWQAASIGLETAIVVENYRKGWAP